MKFRNILLISLILFTHYSTAENSKFKSKQTAVSFVDKKNSKTDSFTFFESTGTILVIENPEEKKRQDKDLKDLKDYKIQGMFFDFPSFNSDSIFIQIDSVDLTKQSLTSDGFVQLSEVKVNYKNYIQGFILGRKIADKTVTQNLITQLTNPVTVDNYDYLFKRKFKLVNIELKDVSEQEGQYNQSKVDICRLDLIQGELYPRK
jgi:hypothetical protein